jgi:hypothetical protein
MNKVVTGQGLHQSYGNIPFELALEKISSHVKLTNNISQLRPFFRTQQRCNVDDSGCYMTISL